MKHSFNTISRRKRVNTKKKCLTMYQRAVLMMYMFLVFATVIQPVSAYAGTGYNWAKDADKSIYEGEGKSSNTEQKSSKPKSVEKWFSKMLVNGADQLQEVFHANGIGLNNILFGRVNGYGDPNNGIAYYTYDLSKGNPYGVISMMLYKIMAQMMLVAIVLIAMGRLVQAMYSSGNGQARQNFKETMKTSLLSFGVVSIMPSLVSIMLYLRDVVIYAVSSQAGSIGIDFSSSGGIVSAFRKMCCDTDGTFTGSYEYQIVPSLMYLGIVVITLFFMLEYVGMAMAMVIMMICFPFIAIEMNFDKSALSSWFKSVLSVLITPVMDITLFMLPLAFGSGNEHALLHLTLCALIIPSRNVIKTVLRLSAPGSNLMSGLAAIAAIRLAANGAKRLGGRAIGAAGTLKSAGSDLRKSKEHKEMANAEREDMSTNMRRNNLEAYDANAMLQRNGKKKRTGQFGIAGEDGFGKKKRTENAGFNGMSENASFDPNKMDENVGVKQRLQKFGAKASTGMSEQDKRELGMKDRMNADAASTRKEINDLKSSNAAIDTELAQKKAKRSALQNQINMGKASGDLDPETLQANQKEIGKLDNEIGDLSIKKAKNNEKLSKLNAKAGNFRMMSGGAGGASSGHVGVRQAETLSKLANIRNFEEPEFSSISHDQKAKLYRNRALATIGRNAAVGAAGITGDAVGFTMGAGASTFMSIPAKAATIGTTTAITGAAASGVANVAVSAGAGAANVVTNFVHRNSNKGGDVERTVVVNSEVAPMPSADSLLVTPDISGITGSTTVTNAVMAAQSAGTVGQAVEGRHTVEQGMPATVNYTVDVQTVMDTVSSFNENSGRYMQSSIDSILSSVEDFSAYSVPNSIERNTMVAHVVHNMARDLATECVHASMEKGLVANMEPGQIDSQIRYLQSFLENDHSIVSNLKERAEVQLTDAIASKKRKFEIKK